MSRYEIGESYFLRARLVDIYSDGQYQLRVVVPVNSPLKSGYTEIYMANEPGLLLTAEEVAEAANLHTAFVEEDLTARLTEPEAANATLEARYKELDTLCKEVMATRDEAIKQNNELIAKNGKLKQQLADANELLSDAQAEVKELTEADCMRVQEFKPIIEERDRLKAEVITRTENVKNLMEEVDAVKAELEQEKKRTQVWKDSSEEHRQRAEELEADVKRYGMDIADNEVKIQRLGQENDSLKADILELKAQINVFGSRPSEIEEMKAERDSARGQADLFKAERDELDAKVQKHTDTLRKWSKKIHSQDDEIKQKDLIISLLAAMVLELEKGGESNG